MTHYPTDLTEKDNECNPLYQQDWTNVHSKFRYCPNVGLCNAFSHGWKTSEG